MFRNNYNKKIFKLSSWEKKDKKTLAKKPLNKRIVFESLSGTERRASSKAQFLYIILLIVIGAVFYFVGSPSKKKVEPIKINDSLIQKQ